MAVTDQTPIGGAVGNGVTTVFPFSYYIGQDSDLVVQRDGVTATLNVDYVVSGAGNPSGGQITFSTAPASGVVVSHFRDTELARTTDYQDGGDLPARTVNRDFDRLWLAIQEILNGGKASKRALRVPAGEEVAEFPPADARKGKIVAFDSVTGALALISAATGSILDFALQLASSAGSSLIGFLQSGSGAVLRTVQQKLLGIYDVEDFSGANDSLKIQAAINAAPNGSRIRFKAGQTYTLTKNTSLLPGVYTAGDQPCICVYQKSHLVLDLQGALLKCDVHGQGVLDILESQFIEVVNYRIQGDQSFYPIDGTTGRAEKGSVSAGLYNASAVANGPQRNNSQNTSGFSTGGYGGAFPQFGGGTAPTWGTWKGGGYLTNTGSGIFIGKGSSDIYIGRGEVYGFNEAGVQIDAPITEYYGWAAPNRVTLENCYLHDNYDSGWSAHRCEVLKVLHVDSKNNGHPNASIAHADIDPGYGGATNNGTAPRYLQIIGGTYVGNKRKGLDAHSIDTAIIDGPICTDSGYGLMLVNGSGGVIRDLVVSNVLVSRIAYPVTAQGTGVYIERNASGAAGFAGRVVLSNINVSEVGVPPGQEALYPGANPAGIGVLLSGNLDGAVINGVLAQNTTYKGFIAACMGFAGSDAVTGLFSGIAARGKWTIGINNLASGGTNSATSSCSVELTSVAPYAGGQTGVKGEVDRHFSGLNINVPAGQALVEKVFLNVELVVRVVMTGTGSTTWTTIPNQAKYLTSVASNANGLQFNLAPGINSQAITWSQAASAKAVRTSGAVPLDHIYVRTETGSAPAIGLQASGTDHPSNNCTGSITFKILI